MDNMPEGFLADNEGLENVSFPQITAIGDGFLSNQKPGATIDLPKIENIDLSHKAKEFLAGKEGTQSLELPKLPAVREGFLSDMPPGTTIDLPSDFPRLEIPENIKPIYTKFVLALNDYLAGDWSSLAEITNEEYAILTKSGYFKEAEYAAYIVKARHEAEAKGHEAGRRRPR